MWTMGVEMVLVLGEHLAQVRRVDDQNPVEDLAVAVAVRARETCAVPCRSVTSKHVETMRPKLKTPFRT